MLIIIIIVVIITSPTMMVHPGRTFSNFEENSKITIFMLYLKVTEQDRVFPKVTDQSRRPVIKSSRGISEEVFLNP